MLPVRILHSPTSLRWLSRTEGTSEVGYILGFIRLQANDVVDTVCHAESRNLLSALHVLYTHDGRVLLRPKSCHRCLREVVLWANRQQASWYHKAAIGGSKCFPKAFARCCLLWR